MSETISGNRVLVLCNLWFHQKHLPGTSVVILFRTILLIRTIFLKLIIISIFILSPQNGFFWDFKYVVL